MRSLDKDFAWKLAVFFMRSAYLLSTKNQAKKIAVHAGISRLGLERTRTNRPVRFYATRRFTRRSRQDLKINGRDYVIYQNSIQKLLLEITFRNAISIARSLRNDWSRWRNSCSSSSIFDAFGQFSRENKVVFFKIYTILVRLVTFLSFFSDTAGKEKEGQRLGKGKRQSSTAVNR